MRVKADGKTFDVNFEHRHADKKPVSTRCEISLVKGKDLVKFTSGYSSTKHGDQFDKGVGRRKAFDKALVSVWPKSIVTYSRINGYKIALAPAKNKLMRQAFWKAYFKSVEAPKPEAK